MRLPFKLRKRNKLSPKKEKNTETRETENKYQLKGSIKSKYSGNPG